MVRVYSGSAGSRITAAAMSHIFVHDFTIDKDILYSLGKLGRPFKVSCLLYLLEIEQDKICVGILLFSL